MISSLMRAAERRRAVFLSATYAAVALIVLLVWDWGLGLLVMPAHFPMWSLGKDLVLVGMTALWVIRLQLTRTDPGQRIASEPELPHLGGKGSPESPGADPTQRMWTDESPHESERWIRNLARNIPGVVYQFRVKADGSYCFDYLGTKAEEIFGLSPKRQGADWRELGAMIHPDDRASFLDSVMNAVVRRADWEFEGRLIGLEAQSQWLQGLSSLVEDGDEVVFQGVFLDITQRKRVDEQLRKLSVAVESSPVSVVITDRE